jgi:hypothetical protein
VRKPWLFFGGALAFLLFLAPVTGHSQSGAAAPAAGQSSQQPTAANAAPAPAVSSTPAAQSQPTPIANAKPAKVWTNEDVGKLSGDGISVVGKPASPNTSSTSAKPRGYSMEKDPNWYRKQLQPLQAEIDQLNAQIEKTKAFLSGDHVNDTSGTIRAYYGLPGNPQDQLKKLESRRDKDVATVNDLLDRARRNDVPPGALR